MRRVHILLLLLLGTIILSWWDSSRRESQRLEAVRQQAEEFRAASLAQLTQLYADSLLLKLKRDALRLQADTAPMSLNEDVLRAFWQPWREERTKLKEEESAFRKAFLSLEKAIKDRHAGALPLWVKDDRNWQALDRGFRR